MPIAPLPALLEGLMTKHYRPLVRYLRSRVRCEETAADLAQESFLRLALMTGRDHIRDHSAYLFRTAANLANDHLRATARSGTAARSPAPRR